MEVYIVMYDNPYEWREFEVIKIFESEEKAKKYIDSQKNKDDFYIDKYKVE